MHVGSPVFSQSTCIKQNLVHLQLHDKEFGPNLVTFLMMTCGAYPGPPICGIPGMMCWGFEGTGCQGCLREGEED